MSYNLLLDTTFKKLNKHWKLTNCEYQNGYLVGKDKYYSIEQEIVLPDPTKLYFAIDYICLTKNIEKIYCGIQIDNTLEADIRPPKLHRRKRISVVNSNKQAEKVIVKFIVEATLPDTRIYIDSPLLVDLSYHDKDWWPKWMLNKTLDYRYGYDYSNIYNYGAEFTLSNTHPLELPNYLEEGNVGILAHIKNDTSILIKHDFKKDHYYLLKLDYEQVNNYGDILATYGEINSVNIDNSQLYIIFKADTHNLLHLILKNSIELSYIVNLKRLLLVDLSDMCIDLDDIPHLPFI